MSISIKKNIIWKLKYTLTHSQTQTEMSCYNHYSVYTHLNGLEKFMRRNFLPMPKSVSVCVCVCVVLKCICVLLSFTRINELMTPKNSVDVAINTEHYIH